jgi:hypothetical protein
MEFRKQRKQKKEEKNKSSGSEYLCAVMIEGKPVLFKIFNKVTFVNLPISVFFKVLYLEKIMLTIKLVMVFEF